VRLAGCFFVGQWRLGLQPALRLGQLAPLPGFTPAHDPGFGDVPVGVALAHAQQGLSVVMHLELLRAIPASGQKPTG